MSDSADHHATRRKRESWQRRVWARIAREARGRSGWQGESISHNVDPLGGNMSDDTEHEAVVSLQRADRRRPSRLRALVRLTWLWRLLGLGSIVALGILVIRRVDAHDDHAEECATAFANDPKSAVTSCELAFRHDHDAVSGNYLSRGLFATQKWARAESVATELLATPACSDALQLLGKLAMVDNQGEEAIRFLRGARALHRAEHQTLQAALDAGLLAGPLTDYGGQFTEALQLLDECIKVSTRHRKKETQFFCHLHSARTLIAAGYYDAAKNDFDDAARLADSGMDRADIDYQLGNEEQERRNHNTAVAFFERALRRYPETADDTWTSTVELNLAFSLAKLGRFDDARKYLERAALHDLPQQTGADQAWVEATIAYEQGDLGRAASAVTRYFERVSPEATDDRFRVATLRSQIELDRGDLASAALRAEQAIAEVENALSAQSVLELRPWILRKRRPPYELLFTAYARAHRPEHAAIAFGRWQGRTTQDALVTRRANRSVDRLEIAEQVGQLGEWLRKTSKATFAAPPNGDDVLRTMQSIELFALIVANEELWRLTANHGAPRLDRIASMSELQDRIDQFRGRATEPELAAELGRLLVPDDVFRSTDEVLYVLLDDQLDDLPIAALRHGAGALIEGRPIVRLFRLPEGHCSHPALSWPATVLSDPLGDLQSAREEGDRVAALLHTTSMTGAAANRNALLGAGPGAVLHVAAHGDPDDSAGAAIMLKDGSVSALEIAATQRAPSLVVLSACNAGASGAHSPGSHANTSGAPELAGSLAAGFLAAGAQHVVATLWPVSDAGALEISTGFYRADGVTDPARALQRVQAELVTTKNLDWPYFAVFEPDACSGEASREP